ncbi:MAG: carboxypeptidase-like regulatory domain-containing protein [Acidobacteria bacterium]|nr:carboxypeptidase-like regulatory domain-containing protein [Acidobacteriota bacterium]
MHLSRILFPVLLVLALVACGGDGSTPAGPTDPARASHNAGRDCLQCHNFTLAGTVYRDDGSTYPGAVVRITSQAEDGGEVLVNVTTDASGNFYTSTPVGWDDGLYTDVQGTGVLRSMGTSVPSGACNSCHAGADRIHAD